MMFRRKKMSQSEENCLREVLHKWTCIFSGSPSTGSRLLQKVPKTPTRRKQYGDLRRHPGPGTGLGLRRWGRLGVDKPMRWRLPILKGLITLRQNAPDLGQGIFNVISVIAVRSLGIPQEQVSVVEPDTRLKGSR